MTLTGKITEEGNRLLLTVDDVKPGPQVFLLAQGKSKDAKEKGQMEKAFKDARSLVGEVVEMEGVWKPPVNKSEKDTPATLFLRRAIKAPERRRGKVKVGKTDFCHKHRREGPLLSLPSILFTSTFRHPSQGQSFRGEGLNRAPLPRDYWHRLQESLCGPRRDCHPHFTPTQRMKLFAVLDHQIAPTPVRILVQKNMTSI